MGISVGIMTFLHNDNYGSALQAYALQRVLRELGAEAEHIDYRPSPGEKLRNLLTSGNSPRLIAEGLAKRRVRARWAGARAKAAAFPAFYQAYMRLSPPCRNRRELRARARRYDLLLCGSDQIWSPTWFNPAYFLCFAAKGQPKAAYAPSLGVRELPPGAKGRRMARLLQGFERLSVREEEGQRLLQGLLPGAEIPVLPDPVCLLTREDWLALAQLPRRKHPYLLCYFLGERADYWRQVEALRARTGLRVKVIPLTQEAYAQPYDLCPGLTPQAFLGYLAEAALVCTDSFHATAFSILFQRPFVVRRRDPEGDPRARNSRIDSLLRRLGLDWEGEDIPWENAAAQLREMRRAGREYLQALLEAKA